MAVTPPKFPMIQKLPKERREKKESLESFPSTLCHVHCLALPCFALPCLALLYLVLPYLTLPFLPFPFLSFLSLPFPSLALPSTHPVISHSLTQLSLMLSITSKSFTPTSTPIPHTSPPTYPIFFILSSLSRCTFSSTFFFITIFTPREEEKKNCTHVTLAINKIMDFPSKCLYTPIKYTVNPHRTWRSSLRCYEFSLYVLD